MRVTVKVLCVAVCLALASTSCSDGDGDEGTSDAGSTSAPASTTSEAPPPEIAAGTQEPWPCPAEVTVAAPAEVECLRVTLPERAEAPDDGATVTLPVARITRPGQPATTPVVFLDGGPGGDGITAAEDLATLPFAAERPIVIVGQRGTPFAEPSLDCAEVEAVERDQFDSALDDTTDDQFQVALGECFARADSTGATLSSFDTVHAADDVEGVRRTLGIDQWDLLSLSYGTTLALEVMRRRPDGVRSAVLDSVYPPDVEAYASLVPGLERAIGELVAACAEDAGCAPLAPTLMDRIQALYDQLEAEPVDSVGVGADGEQVAIRWDGTRMAEALFSALYSAALVPLLPSLLESLEQGDVALATTYYLELVPASLESLAEGLYQAVECRERAPFSDPVEIRETADGVDPWMVEGAGGEASLEDCEHWVAEPLASRPGPVVSDIPTLVLAGRFDPITPPAWGEGVVDDLTDATFVQVETGGHVTFFDECGASIVTAFLADPSAELDEACAQETAIAWVLE